MKKLILTACALGLAVNFSVAQFGPRPMDPPPPYGGERVPSPEILELRLQVRTLRAELETSRAALRASIAEDATQEERIAAVEQWHVDNAALLAELRVLSAELAGAVREARPGPAPIEVPDEIADMRSALQEARAVLEASRASLIESLGEDATDEEIRAALATWREENADAIAANRAMAEEIREWFQSQRPERPGHAVSQAARQRQADFRETATAIREARRNFGEELNDPTLTREQRREMVEDYRTQQKELLRERAELKRQERLNQTGEGGDRRPGG